MLKRASNRPWAGKSAHICCEFVVIAQEVFQLQSENPDVCVVHLRAVRVQVRG